MTTQRISGKGQVTLPAKMRKQLRIEPKSKVKIEVRDAEIVIRRACTAPGCLDTGLAHAAASRERSFS